MQRCAFRLDDITPDMNWNNFESLKQIFDKYNITPLLGIVPDNKDTNLSVDLFREDFWDVMVSLKEQGWSISQHGYCHIYETEDSGLLGINPFSEFAGLPYVMQYEKLKKGKDILKSHNLDTDIFMAPGHTYDSNTLKALEQNGFKFVTDGYSEKPYRKKGLIFIPSRMSGPGTIKGIDTICLHLNTMSAEQIKALDKYIEQNRDKMCSYTEVLTPDLMNGSKFIAGFQEKKNLFIRKMKKVMANSRAIQRYLQKSYSDKKIKKLCKRAVMWPLIFYYMLKGEDADE